MNLGQVIERVRDVIQDTDEAMERYSNDTLVRYANLALGRIAVLRPDLFAKDGDFECQAGAKQNLKEGLPEGSNPVRLVEVFGTATGGITEIDRDVLNRMHPAWLNDPAGPALEYIRHKRNPNVFFVNPRSVAGQVLKVEYAESPKYYEKDEEEIELLPDAYLAVVVDATIYMVESMNDESVNSGRAQLYLRSFTDMLGVSAEGRVVIDTESSGQPSQDADDGN